MRKLSEQEIERIVSLLREGKPLPEDYKTSLFDTKKEYELVYADKEREEDILADTIAVPLQPIKTFRNGEDGSGLSDISRLDQHLLEHFRSKFVLQPMLNRSLVSFQANKNRPIYRWYKFKEAFSASLVEYLLQRYNIRAGRILDPFAGSGTTLFAASAMGINADGIEILPIGQQIITTKKILDAEFTPDDFERLRQWSALRVWEKSEKGVPLPELRITQGAYPERTREAIQKYLGACQEENVRVQAVLRFALLCALEPVSFTRKDGQYLRWDYRSGRTQGKKPFDKGEILSFEKAICEKINEIVSDISRTHPTSLLPPEKYQGEIRLYAGSCLEVLPKLQENSYNAIVTSPPYCNRYDYTRTYALELAILGINEKELSNLRQAMLSSTVENRAKELLKMNPKWKTALAAADEQELLQAILKYLEAQKARGELNNNGIPRMVRGYFYEMACVIAECARVLKPGALLFMVNDNVRYAGASISVDMILSNIGEKLGFQVENILVLPNGKGNSSQQMGEHGREELRKCIYVWRKQQ
ncbi:Methyltransferase domain [Chthonomonas calidirosea]|uniref:site-specific DNA-methyltransferase (cytosine-N(4)-specific) n=1 Tax=Chthonomonas calidirosea (strain DSM 23976 / ICMP 18418 / T49) TaxID=1303518 RepID=S0EY83_CHTCT|nr:DNA methyltransferase [Chthonomonas calidirosea]CCW34781.1 Methyltransferase domain [Chthonomonas calidirosea T49]CEK13814.1 Methyltransferase domain [Chthonomonas calidirosea]